MEIPERVAQIQSYVQLKSERAELEKKVKALRKHLAEMEAKLSQLQSQEQEALTRIDQTMLVDRNSIKLINDLLSRAVSISAWGDVFPVGCAVLTSEKGKMGLSIVFSQPIFSGWRTEKPYVSWQMCPRQLETPVPPSESHIPQYTEMIEPDVGDLACWELSGSELRLWGKNGAGVVVFGLRLPWDTKQATKQATKQELENR